MADPLIAAPTLPPPTSTSLREEDVADDEHAATQLWHFWGEASQSEHVSFFGSMQVTETSDHTVTVRK